MDEQLLKEIQAMKESLVAMQHRLRAIEQRAAAEGSTPTVSTPPTPAPIPAVTLPPRMPSPAPTVPSTPPPQPSPLIAKEASAKLCVRHPNQEICWTCATCSIPLCGDCGGIAFGGRVYCARCGHGEAAKPVAESVRPSADAKARGVSVSASSVTTPPQPSSERSGDGSKPQPGPAADQEQDGETLETRVGRYWLNRVGIITLVLGVVFFILYSFHYLGPAMKIAMGVAVALGLLGGGVWLERRAGLSWYARGLIGGGWALLYFTTYAMHHIPAVRILDEGWIDLSLLMMVAAGAVWHSMRYRSETITALALLLGFITTSISYVTWFTLASSGCLVAALGWLVVRMRWDRLYLYGVLASYGTHLVWISPQIGLSPATHMGAADAALWLNAGFLSLYWVVYHAVLFALDEREGGSRNRLVTATLMNATLFVYAILVKMGPIYPEWRYLFLLGVGTCYLVSGLLGSRTRLPSMSAIHELIGLSLITLAIPLKLTGRWLSFWWLMEVALLVWIGLRYQRWSYRNFAFWLMAIMFFRLLVLDLRTSAPIAMLSWNIPWRVVIGGWASAAFSVVAVLYRRPQFRETLRPIESGAFHSYCLAALVPAWLLTYLELPAQWIAAGWAIESAIVMAMGFKLRDSTLRFFATVGFGLTGLRLIGVPGVWAWWSISVIIAAVYGVSWLYRWSSSDEDTTRPGISDGYAIAALVILTMLFHTQVSWPWISLAWLAQLFVLLSVGLLVQERNFRAFAVIFALLVVGQLAYQLTGWSRSLSIYPPLQLLGFTIPWRWAVGGIGVAAFGASAWWYRLPRVQSSLRPIESHAFHLYFFCAALLLWTLLSAEISSPWISAAWTVESALIVLLGFKLRDQLLRLAGAGGCAMAALQWLGTIGSWNLGSSTMMVGLLYGLSLTYRWARVSERERIEPPLEWLYTVGGSVMLTLLLHAKISHHWVSVAWALEGFALIAVGFLLREKVWRSLGLIAFGLLMLNILFVDLAGAETIYRIVSFIAAGAILLAASFAYAKFSGNPAPPNKP